MVSLGTLMVVGALAAAPTVETYLHAQQLGAAALSPDGRTAVAQVLDAPLTATSFDDETVMDAQRSRLIGWSVGDGGRGGRRLWRRAALPGPFSPSGRLIAVLRTKQHRLQLGVMNTANGALRWSPIHVEAPGLGRTLQWRSDTELVALSPAPGAVPQVLETGEAAQRRVERLWRRQRLGRRPSVTLPLAAAGFVDGPRRLASLDIASNTVHTLMTGAILDFELSPNGRTAAVLLRAEPRPLSRALSLTVAEHLRRTALTLVDVARPSLRTDCAGDVMPTLLSWSPDSRRLLAAVRDPVAFGWGRTQFILAGEGGCSTLGSPLATPDLDASNGEGLPVVAAAWSAGAPMVGLADASGERRWMRLGLGLSPQQISPPGGVPSSGFESAARSRLAAPPSSTPACLRGRLLAAQGSARMCSEVSPQGVTALRLEAKGHGRVVMRLNPQFARVRWSRPQPIADGPLSHWLYRPIGSTSAPLVVLPYPGAVYAHAPSAYAPGSGSLVTQAQVLVGHGYAVLVPSLKASRGGRPDLKFAARIDTAVNAAIAAGGIDAHRIALWGHSFGGYAALIAAEASTRFDAVIAEHAPVDFVSSRGVLPFPARAYADPDRYLEFQYGWTEGGQAGFAAPPAMARAAYVEASATARADRLRAPVLLVNGDQDFVTPGQAEELAAELRRHDQSVELLTYWGEGHVLLSPANIRDFYRRSFAFLDSALLAAPRASRKLSSRAPLRRAAMSPLPPPPERPRLPAMSGPR